MSPRKKQQPVLEASTDAATPAGRTATQATGAGAVVYCLLAFNIVKWTPEQVVAFMGALTVAWAFVQNVLERVTGRPFLIKPK